MHSTSCSRPKLNLASAVYPNSRAPGTGRRIPCKWLLRASPLHADNDSDRDALDKPRQLPPSPDSEKKALHLPHFSANGPVGVNARRRPLIIFTAFDGGRARLRRPFLQDPQRPGGPEAAGVGRELGSRTCTQLQLQAALRRAHHKVR